MADREEPTVLTEDFEMLVDDTTFSVFMSVCFVSTILDLTTGSTMSAVAVTVFTTLVVTEGLDVGVGGGGGTQISARVLNFGPRLLRNCRSLSDSRRLQQPTEPADEPWPSKS